MTIDTLGSSEAMTVQELERAHRALEDANARLATLDRIFAQAPVAVAVVDGPRHVFSLANAAYTALVNERALIGRTVRDALPELEGQGIFAAESERQLRTLADAIPTLAWTARPDGFIDWYNARWYEYTGTTQEEMAGWGWQSVHDPAHLPSAMEKWRAGMGGDLRVRSEEGQ